MTCLVRSGAAPGSTLTRPGITATACSRQLLSGASFYELPSVRALLPQVLVAELCGAQERLTAAAKGGLFDGLYAQMEAANVQPCVAAAHALGAAQPAAARAAVAAQAVLDAFAVVRVLSWIPSEYFSSLPELPALLAALCRLEKVLIAAVLCGAARSGSVACQAVAVLRRVVTGLMTVSAGESPEWADPAQVRWIVESVDVLVLLAVHPHSDCDFHAEAVALATGALLAQLSSGAAGCGSMVLASVTSSCSNLRDLAAFSASDASPTEQPSAFLPRMVKLQQRQPKSQPGPCSSAAAPTRHVLAVSKATVAASVLTSVVGARPAREWLALQHLVADTLDSVCSSAQSVSLCRPLFTSLAATLELEAGAGLELEQKLPISTERLTALLHAAAQLLAHDTVCAVESLRYLKAAVEVLLQRDALPDSVCRSLLALHTAVLRAHVAGAVEYDACSGDAGSLRSAALDSFAALAATASEQQQAFLVDTLINAAQDVPVAAGVETPVQWASLSAALQLLGVLVRTFPKPACARNSERCLGVATLACAHVGHATTTPLVLLEQVALPAVSLLDALLKSRSRFPLRGSSVACALAVPATLFDRSSQLAAVSGPPSHSVYVACCSLLATVARCRPHELQRCMPLLSSSCRVLAGALLQGVQALDGSCGSPVPAALLNCAAELGALYSVVAAEETARSGRRAASVCV